MTTVESGTAVNIEYPPEETKAVAIHEAGHAAASHVYAKDTESTRISIRMRGASLGHHQSAEQQERFHRWRSDEMATLIHVLGAMAAAAATAPFARASWPALKSLAAAAMFSLSVRSACA